MRKTPNQVTCNKCGWVSYEISRKDAETSIRLFNKYFDSLTEKEKEELYGNHTTSIDDYTRCHRCGGSYVDFRDADVDDCPDGCTTNPILSRLE